MRQAWKEGFRGTDGSNDSRDRMRGERRKRGAVTSPSQSLRLGLAKSGINSKVGLQ